jgi:hypothetical protein
MKAVHRSIGFCLWSFTAIAAGCETREIDLGMTDGGSGAVAVGPRANPDQPLGAAYGCGDWIEAELNDLRAGTCEGSCSVARDGPYPLDSKPSMMAATAGRWSFCGARIGPADAVGIEFAPGCRVFFLRLDDAGIAVRGTEAAYQADYDIYDPRPEGVPARIDLHLTATDTMTLRVEAFRCPERVLLRRGDELIDLGRFDGHGGTGDPVK